MLHCARSKRQPAAPPSAAGVGLADPRRLDLGREVRPRLAVGVRELLTALRPPAAPRAAASHVQPCAGQAMHRRVGLFGVLLGERSAAL
jgi:hypothetical protein